MGYVTAGLEKWLSMLEKDGLVFLNRLPHSMSHLHPMDETFEVAIAKALNTKALRDGVLPVPRNLRK